MNESNDLAEAFDQSEGPMVETAQSQRPQGVYPIPLDGEMSERPARPHQTIPLSKRGWHDLSEGDKINRLRGIVKDQQRIINRLCSYMDQLTNHQHFDGQIVKRVSDPGSEGNGYGFKDSMRSRPDEWF